MPSKNGITRIFGESSHLSTGISQYTKERFPTHTIETIEGVHQRVINTVDKIKPDQYGIFGFMGLPGSGKTNRMDEIEFKVALALGMQEGSNESSFFSYHSDDGAQIGIGGYRGVSGRIGTFHADNFFRALGNDRRGVMLQNESNFRSYWGRNRDWFHTVRSVFSGIQPETRLYFATPDERESKTPRGHIQVSDTNPSGGKNIILLEGVNVGYCMNKVQRLVENQRVRFIKILFDTSPEYSVIKVLRRDRNVKGYSFEDILLHRIVELFYIIPVFIYPALRDKSTMILRRKMKNIPFTEEEQAEIMRAIYLAQSIYQYSGKFSDKQKKFAQTLLANLEKIMENMPVATEEELSNYVLQKERKRYG